jgi:hypothetical protein
MLKGMREFLRLVLLVVLVLDGKPLVAAPAAKPTVAPAIVVPGNPAEPDLSDLAERWGRGVEAAIESAYRVCFRTFVIEGRIITLRMPFGENNDRSKLAGWNLAIQGGGKADPRLLWEGITALVEGPDFQAY